MPKLVITGSSGLIGSEAVLYFEARGYRVLGIDNNMRARFFGPRGDTTWNLERLKHNTVNFEALDLDIRDRQGVEELFKRERPDAILHCAAQPSHDLAKDLPFDDFDVNAGGTLALLEATRQWAKDSPFVFLSTNKVYGTAPNDKPLIERTSRFDYAKPEDFHGIDEHCPIDQTTHSLFGASKVAADIMTQEYGRYFDMPTVCLRGGCLTGPNHSGVELHGFLSYLVQSAVERRPYTVIGYGGKQVRDQIHSLDVCRAIDVVFEAPRGGEVYNLGGGRENNASVLESIELVQGLLETRLDVQHDPTPRKGDHICYISDTRKLRAHYPGWELTVSIPDMIRDMGLKIAERSDQAPTEPVHSD